MKKNPHNIPVYLLAFAVLLLAFRSCAVERAVHERPKASAATLTQAQKDEAWNRPRDWERARILRWLQVDYSLCEVANDAKGRHVLAVLRGQVESGKQEEGK